MDLLLATICISFCKNWLRLLVLLYHVLSLIGAALKLCCEKEDGLVFQPYNPKLGCLGFFPDSIMNFSKLAWVFCALFLLSFPHLLYNSAQKGKIGESWFDCYQTQTSSCLQTDYRHSCVEPRGVSSFPGLHTWWMTKCGAPSVPSAPKGWGTGAQARRKVHHCISVLWEERNLKCVSDKCLEKQKHCPVRIREEF